MAVTMEGGNRGLAPVVTASGTCVIQVHATRMNLYERCTMGSERKAWRARSTDGTLKLAGSSRRHDSAQSLQNWLTRSQSSVHSAPGWLGAPTGLRLPLSSHGSETGVGQIVLNTAKTASIGGGGEQRTGLATGRQTKASLLRFRSCPESYTNMDLTAVASKRKNFERQCRNHSASAIVCSSLPKGETLHSFVVGARYNSANVLDSHSLEHTGVYISRKNLSKVFVNPAGTIPHLPAKQGECRWQRGSRIQPAVAPPTSPATTCIYSRSADLLTPSTPMGSSLSVDHEIDDVFGPNQGSTGSSLHSSSDTGTGGQIDEEGENKFLHAAGGGSAEFEQAGNEEGHQLQLPCARGPPAAATPGSAERSTSTDRLPLGDRDEAAPLGGSSSERSDNTASPTGQVKSEPTVAPASEQQLDLISPEAQLITDEILKEARSSRTSIASSVRSSSTATLECERLSSSSTPSQSTMHTASNALQTSSQSIKGDSGPVTTTRAGSALPGPTASTPDGNNGRLETHSSRRRPASGGRTDHHTDKQLADEKSSSIFIDLQSRLQAQEYNGDSD